jgi:hypothetical protein
LAQFGSYSEPTSIGHIYSYRVFTLRGMMIVGKFSSLHSNPDSVMPGKG